MQSYTCNSYNFNLIISNPKSNSSWLLGCDAVCYSRVQTYPSLRLLPVYCASFGSAPRHDALRAGNCRMPCFSLGGGGARGVARAFSLKSLPAPVLRVLFMDSAPLPTKSTFRTGEFIFCLFNKVTFEILSCKSCIHKSCAHRIFRI